MADEPAGEGGSDAREELRALTAGLRANLAARELSGHEGAVYAVAVSRDGKRLISVGADGTTRCWSVAEGRAMSTLPM